MGMSFVSVLRHTHEAMRLGTDQAIVAWFRWNFHDTAEFRSSCQFHALGIASVRCLLDLRPVELATAELAAELHAQFAESAHLEKLIKKNLKGLGFSGEKQ